MKERSEVFEKSKVNERVSWTCAFYKTVQWRTLKLLAGIETKHLDFKKQKCACAKCSPPV